MAIVRNLILCLPIVLASLCVESGAQEKKSELRSMKYTSRSKEEARVWQNTLRSKLFTILKLDDLIAREQPIPFHTGILSSVHRDRYIEKEIAFHSTPGRRIKAIVTIPDSVEKPCPAVVCIHGHGGNRRSTHEPGIYKAFAAVLASRGCVTISMDVGQHNVYESGRILMGERLWDVMRCVDYLETMPQVDRARIGCAGLSLGGEMAMWLGAMDTRIAATVSSGFLTVMDQMEENHCMCWKFDGLRELVDFADIYSLTAPRFLQCQNGLQESPKMFTVPLARKALEEIKEIYSDFGAIGHVELDVHAGGHEIDLPGLLAFFEKRLLIRQL